MKEINLEIITPSKQTFNGKVKSVTVPGTAGSFQVLFNHAPLLSTFEIGKVKIEDLEGKEIEFATSGGTVEVTENKILILADSLETKEEVDVQRALKSYERAKERLAARSKDVDTFRVESALARAINRLKFTNTAF
ncbi:MAG: F0F1 ATP synthase subunit epsilon [Ignavibacteria bacterium]|nr:MAG: F0F1 ATP synthase subunit epsilon [Ignavibacteria bacterium]KAF0158106.1 MAG: F0F1 ATP synthase subunit epsilon [Ignavibacteria bacterium]